MDLDLHLVPGHFSEGAPRLLERLSAGVGTLRFEEVSRTGDAGSVGDDEVFAWLAATGDRAARSATFRVTGEGLRPLEGRLESLPVGSTDRLLLGLRLGLPDDRDLSAMKNLEMALLGVACAALAAESQGAVLVGFDLAPLGAGLPRGTVSEQVLGLLEVNGERVQLFVCTADTAESLGEISGYQRSALGDLFEYRA